MLSRLGSRCRAYPQMKTFDQTLDLFFEHGTTKARGKEDAGADPHWTGCDHVVTATRVPVGHYNKRHGPS